MTLNLAHLPGRCVDCEWHPATQGHSPNCAVPAANKADGIARADDAAEPEWKDRIDDAIRRHAATGREFSANDLRFVLADVPGPVVGARFNAAARAGVIRRVGYVPSNKANTHAHPIALWVGTR